MRQIEFLSFVFTGLNMTFDLSYPKHTHRPFHEMSACLAVMDLG